MHGQGAPDIHIARLAEQQGGVVSFAQLRALPLSAVAIDNRVRSGRLHRLHRGVFAVGHPLVDAKGRRWAAVLALDGPAFVSHQSSGDAFGFRPNDAAIVHVTVRGRGGRKPRPGVRVHRPRYLLDDEVTTLDRLPITTPSRTLLDLAGSGLRGRALEAALDRAELLRVLDFAELEQLLARYPRHPGTRALKAQLERYRGPVDARSELERLVYELCAVHGLPRPRVNTVIEGSVRDFYWPRCRLVVEADSYAWHRSPSALNDDRERDVELTLAGYSVLRFTYEQVTRRRDYVLRALRIALGAL